LLMLSERARRPTMSETLAVIGIVALGAIVLLAIWLLYEHKRDRQCQDRWYWEHGYKIKERKLNAPFVGGQPEHAQHNSDDGVVHTEGDDDND